MELPLYNCHKQVRAAKITDINYDRHGAQLVLEVPCGEAVTTDTREVDMAFMDKHRPKIGGYFVEYLGDGYTSFSPAGPFEAGYALASAEQAAAEQAIADGLDFAKA